jgi:hypothetical protein
MKALLFICLLIYSLQGFAENSDNIKYVGSYSSEKYPGEHYLLTEVWLWEKDAELIGLFFVYAGLGGEGPVHPTIFKIDKSIGGLNKDFTFNASGFSFTGQFQSNSISGNLINGGRNWDGGSDKTIFTQGTNIQTIANPGKSLHTYEQWLQWLYSIEVHKPNPAFKRDALKRAP